MEDFLNRKINGEELFYKVYVLRRKLIDRCEKFKLELISSSEKISCFLTGLCCECEHFDEDYQNEEFYTFIKNGFLNFQKALNEE